MDTRNPIGNALADISERLHYLNVNAKLLRETADAEKFTVEVAADRLLAIQGQLRAIRSSASWIVALLAIIAISQVLDLFR